MQRSLRTFHHPLLLLTGLLALALLLAACDDDDNGDDALGDLGDGTPTVAAPAGDDTPAPTPTEEMATETPEAMTPTPAAETPTPAAEGGDGAPTVTVSQEGDLAPYLVGPDGMTLYIFTNDEPGVSNCTGGCLDNWPPLTVLEGEEPTGGEDVPGELGVIERDDGDMHVTYNDMPLYYFAGDQAPGDTNGQGLNDVWWVVSPEGEAITGDAAAAADDGSSGY